MDKTDARRRLEIIEKEASELKKMIAEPEHIEVRYGDYGIVPAGFCDRKLHPVLADSRNIKYDYGYWMDESGRQSCGYSSSNGLKIINRGNIFDDMKRNLVDLHVYNGSMRASGIEIHDNKIRIYSCTGVPCCKEDCSCSHNLDSATSFHQKLGQIIATLERQQNDS